MTDKITIHWFRQDLRLHDNPGLLQAAACGTVLPIYIHDNQTCPEHASGSASQWWLHHSLVSLNDSLDGNLAIYHGRPREIFEKLLSDFNVDLITWNRCYEPWRISRDSDLKCFLGEQGVKVDTFNGSLLWEPWTINKKDGTHYKVFTPFYRKGCLTSAPPRKPLPYPEKAIFTRDKSSLDITSLNLLPDINWDSAFPSYWTPGEIAAHETLETFLLEGIIDYKEGRNFPAKTNVSRLSARLHFGELSPIKCGMQHVVKVTIKMLITFVAN